MIDFDVVDLSECRSEEVMFLLMLIVEWLFIKQYSRIRNI